VALRTTCIKNVRFKVIKIITGCEYVGYFYHSENLNWDKKTLTGHGLDIAGLCNGFFGIGEYNLMKVF